MTSIHPPQITKEALSGWDGRQVLITGGLGFIGSTLTHALVAAGARVRVLDALLPLYGGNWRNLAGIEDRVSTLVSDIRDERQLREAVGGCSAVFHVAAQTSHLDSMEDPLLDADINVRGMLLLLETIRSEAPEATLVNVGTRAQYGVLDVARVAEDGPTHPTDCYGVSKHAAELYALVYARAFGLDARGVRATNSFGPRHQMKHGRYGILNWFVRLALDGEDLTVYGEGNQLRDFLYVDDLVDALLRLGGTRGKPGRIYNVGSGRGVPFREMAETIAELSGRARVVSVPWPEERKRIETGDFVCDPGRLVEETGWRPRIDLREGLRRTIGFYEHEKSHYW